MTELRWIDKSTNEGGITECRFNLERDTGTIPGILWSPTKQKHPVPLVLMGHGGSGHKRDDRQLLLGRRFVGAFQMAAVSIDGPFHGDRVNIALAPHQYQEIMAVTGIDKITDGMINDWYATLDALSKLDILNTDRVAYIGLSMGTRFGLPLVSALGNRLRCAVLGKNGMRASALLNMAPRFIQDAPKITIPILFHMQWDDELFARDGQFELFDLLGARDKRLLAFPGSHSTTAAVAIDAWCEFIACYLAE